MPFTCSRWPITEGICSGSERTTNGDRDKGMNNFWLENLCGKYEFRPISLITSIKRFEICSEKFAGLPIHKTEKSEKNRMVK